MKTPFALKPFSTIDYIKHPEKEKLLVVEKKFDSLKQFVEAEVRGEYVGHDGYLNEEWIKEKQEPPVPRRFLGLPYFEHPMHPYDEYEQQTGHHRYRNRWFYRTIKQPELNRLSTLVTNKMHEARIDDVARREALKELEGEPWYQEHVEAMEYLKARIEALDAPITEKDKEIARKELDEALKKARN